MVWQMPVGLAVSSTLYGFVFALLPVMWIVWNAMWLYNVAVRSGKFDLFRRWMIYNVPPDKRILLLLIAFSFGALLEGAVTGLHPGVLGAMIGRQLPLFGLILPFFALIFYTGFRSLRTAWPVALVAGLSFALTQFTVSNFINYQLTDVLSALISLLCIIGFVQFWRPSDLEQYRASFRSELPGVQMGGHDEVIPRTPIGEENIPAPVEPPKPAARPNAGEAVRAWLPWVLVALVVIFWTLVSVASVGASAIKWPRLHNAIFLTIFHKPYAAIYSFQPLGTGTAILLTVVLTVIFLGLSPALFVHALADTWKQLRFAILTAVLIIGLAYLFNYSGRVYTLGLAISSVGAIFPFFSVFLGWIACFLSGSDTSSNALFGNLQVVAARQLKLSPALMAATNSSGTVMGKMVSPQHVTTAVSTTDLVGKEGLIVRTTIIHSLVLASALGLIVMVQQYLIPGIIP